jgi:aldose sugar dehydrogenase
MRSRSRNLRRILRSRPAQRPCTRRLELEELEGRLLLAVNFTQTNLVSDVPGMAKTTDPNLVNPWGLALGTNSGLWVSENGSGMAESFDGTGQPIQSAVTIPAPGGTGTAAPTGVATNATPGFVITSGGKSGPSTELFATEDGTIAGWNSSVDATHAVIAVDNSASGAVYKGLALGYTADGAFLFATNFHAGTVDVFDSNFKPVRTAGGFRDSHIPAGFAPFGISAINSHLYVTYAKQDADKHDDVAGPGNGFIDIFDTEGRLLQRFTSQGQLDPPWGMAWAPFQGFGEFNNALFVGNFGNGAVNAFDFDSGEFLGTVNDASGNPITIPGVWGLEFGLGVASASSSTLFFTAGIDDEQHGLFGTLTVNPSSLPPPEGPKMDDPSLTVSTVVSGLDQPTSTAFLGRNDFLILEKASGKVQHVVNGTLATPPQFVTPAGAMLANLPVNNASERGLLGIALDPDFTSNHLVYLYWTESSTGAVSGNLAEVGNPNSPFPPGTTKPLGNRVDRFVFDAQKNTLTFDRNLIELHAFQQDDTHPIDAGQPMRGNHDAGKIVFGPDGKLYIQIGDNGRRGQLQNLASGPFGPGQADDQFGGPAPDNAHDTGVIFRLNPDGTAPSDNPFANVTAAQLAQLEQQAGVTVTQAQLDEAVANIHKIFSYGHRNGFGLAFDPLTGALWESENGDDAFDEMNRITAGSNGGWVQIMGPSKRVDEFKEIETTFTPLQGNLPLNGNLPFSPIDPATFLPALQQVRWPPSLIADSPSQARTRLFALPGSHYDEPEFSWKWAVAPAGIGFVGSGLGPQYAGDLFVGEARTFLKGGYLFDFKFDDSRLHFAFDDPALKDKVDDNDYKFDEGESESLIIGENFGIVTDIQTGPDGNLYVTSLTDGKVYQISRRSITVPTPGTPGPVVLTGTDGDDRFVLRLKQGAATVLQVSTDGGTDFTDVALADVTRVEVDGLAGNDTLTVDDQFGLVAKSGGLSIAFDAGTGDDRLVLSGNPGAAADVTYTVGTTVGTGTVMTTTAAAAQTVTFQRLEGVVDTVTAASLTVVGTDARDLIRVHDGTAVNGLATTTVAGLDQTGRVTVRHPTGSEDTPFVPLEVNRDAVDEDVEHGDRIDDNGDQADDDEAAERVEEQTAFTPFTFANKPTVTIQMLGGDDLAVLDARVPAAGLTTLTVDGGAGFDVAIVRSAFPGGNVTVTFPNVERVLMNDANRGFVERLYQLRLERAADDAGANFWNGLLSSGHDRLEVANGIEHSDEARRQLVNSLYRRLLGRDAEQGGLDFWAARLQQGETQEGVMADILASAEFRDRARLLVSTGSDDGRFIRALYLVLLGRTASAAEVSSWLAALPTAGARGVAAFFVGSREFRLLEVGTLYATLLQRQAEAAGLNAWVDSGLDLTTIRAAIEASAEFAGQ